MLGRSFAMLRGVIVQEIDAYNITKLAKFSKIEKEKARCRKTTCFLKNL